MRPPRPSDHQLGPGRGGRPRGAGWRSKRALAVGGAVLVVLVAAAAGDPGAVGPHAAASLQASGRAALEIESADFELASHAQVYNPRGMTNGTVWGNNRNFGGAHRFGLVETFEREPADGELVFEVTDQPDASLYRRCSLKSESDCSDVRVGVDAQGGKLFLYTESRHGEFIHSVSDFPAQAVELSAARSGTPLRVHQEVVVNPAPPAGNCGDYPGRDAQRYACLFLAEHLPDDTPTTTAAMRQALPSLVQAPENYGLVFAEEFNGTADPADCPNGMVTLSSEGHDLWNYNTDPCSATDANGTPCDNIADGHYYMARVHSCGAGMGTEGLFDFKYGYTEVKYRVNRRTFSSYQNMAMALGPVFLPRRPHLARYGIVPTSYRDILTNVGGVVNIFEHLPPYGSQVSHTWVQPWSTFTASRDIRPRRTNWGIRFCNDIGGDHMLNVTPASFCSFTEPVTITQGIEWTPRGYRIFVKIDGVHDDFVVWPASMIEVVHKSVNQNEDGDVVFGNSWTVVPSGTEDQYFEHLDASADSVLLQVGVSHLPMDISTAAWGYPTGRDRTIRTKFEIDYIRVYQPADRYLAMEPVYQ